MIIALLIATLLASNTPNNLPPHDNVPQAKQIDARLLADRLNAETLAIAEPTVDQVLEQEEHSQRTSYELMFSDDNSSEEQDLEVGGRPAQYPRVLVREEQSMQSDFSSFSTDNDENDFGNNDNGDNNDDEEDDQVKLEEDDPDIRKEDDEKKLQ